MGGIVLIVLLLDECGYANGACLLATGWHECKADLAPYKLSSSWHSPKSAASEDATDAVTYKYASKPQSQKIAPCPHFPFAGDTHSTDARIIRMHPTARGASPISNLCGWAYSCPSTEREGWTKPFACTADI